MTPLSNEWFIDSIKASVDTKTSASDKTTTSAPASKACFSPRFLLAERLKIFDPESAVIILAFSTIDLYLFIIRSNAFFLLGVSLHGITK
jgi:hypothetical protein